MTMNLPKLQEPIRYTGLYVIDFGDRSGTGFTAEETAEIVESDRFKDVKVFKIHNAHPDGRLELVGVPRQIFELEMGMFFYAEDRSQAEDDFNRLVNLAVRFSPPARAKVQLAQLSNDSFVTAFMYPAEYNDEFSRWLQDGNFQTSGFVEGGVDACQGYYRQDPKVLRRHQLWNVSDIESLTGRDLLEATNRAIVR
jgi:hypothetical protein